MKTKITDKRAKEYLKNKKYKTTLNKGEKEEFISVLNTQKLLTKKMMTDNNKNNTEINKTDDTNETQESYEDVSTASVIDIEEYMKKNSEL